VKVAPGPARSRPRSCPRGRSRSSARWTARARGRFLGGEERLEEPAGVRLENPTPVSATSTTTGSAAPGSPRADREAAHRARLHRVARVGEQVEEHLGEARAVAGTGAVVGQERPLDLREAHLGQQKSTVSRTTLLTSTTASARSPRRVSSRMRLPIRAAVTCSEMRRRLAFTSSSPPRASRACRTRCGVVADPGERLVSSWEISAAIRDLARRVECSSCSSSRRTRSTVRRTSRARGRRAGHEAGEHGGAREGGEEAGDDQAFDRGDAASVARWSRRVYSTRLGSATRCASRAP